MEKFHHKSVKKGIDFLQAQSPFLGVMCIPTVAIATKYELHVDEILR